MRSIASPACGRAGRLRPLDLFEEREAGVVQDGKHALDERRPRVADRQSQAACTELVRDLDLRQEEGVALLVGAAHALRRPVVDARAEDAHRAARRAQSGAEGGGIRFAPTRERAPQLARLRLDLDRDDPVRRCRPRCRPRCGRPR